MLAITVVGIVIFFSALIYMAYHLVRRSKNKKRVLPIKTFSTALIGGLVLFIVGAVYIVTDSKADLEKAHQEKIELTAKNDELNSLYKELEEENVKLLADNKSMNEENDKLTSKIASSDTLTKELKDKQTIHDAKSKEYENEITDLKAQNTTLTDEVTNLKDQVASSNSVSTLSSSDSDAEDSFDENVSDSSQSYYQNCTAARAAGTAPVYSGDPGYGPHLDRDGDGVGCE